MGFLNDIPSSQWCWSKEYERAITTVANSYVRPEVEKYISNLQTEFDKQMNGASLSILRSDGGLATANAAMNFPVYLLMSGPAGGVSGAIWVGKQADINNIITFARVYEFVSTRA